MKKPGKSFTNILLILGLSPLKIPMKLNFLKQLSTKYKLLRNIFKTYALTLIWKSRIKKLSKNNLPPPPTPLPPYWFYLNNSKTVKAV